MNNLIRGEFEKLSPFHQSKFHELCGWQTGRNVGQAIMSDAAYYKILEWVKRIEEPPVMLEQEELCSESLPEPKKPLTE